MKRLILLGFVTLTSCADPIVTRQVHLVAANQIALEQPIPQAWVAAPSSQSSGTFDVKLANGETLTGTFTLDRPMDASTAGIFGPMILTSSSEVNIAMLASDGRQTMDCAGTAPTGHMNMTCDLTNGAIY
jgi:hypothetical protein